MEAQVKQVTMGKALKDFGSAAARKGVSTYDSLKAKLARKPALTEAERNTKLQEAAAKAEQKTQQRKFKNDLRAIRANNVTRTFVYGTLANIGSHAKGVGYGILGRSVVEGDVSLPTPEASAVPEQPQASVTEPTPEAPAKRGKSFLDRFRS
jgi:hypothetical protein